MTTKPESPAISAPAQSQSLTIPAWILILAILIGGTLFHIWLHHNTHGVFNVHHIVIAVFLILNVWINFWEFGLLACGDQIREEYLAMKDPYKGREMDRVAEFFRQPIRLTHILSFKEWHQLWSAYALFDPSYSRRSGFGFCIDVANGFTTIVPATLFLFGMTFEIMPARWLGIIGVAMFWQMFFGTIVYFWQFVHAGRHKGHPLKVLVPFIGSVNGMWFIVPLWGIALSVWMILNDSYAVFF